MTRTLKLVRFGCGCIGFYDSFEDDRCLILRSCSSTRGDLVDSEKVPFLRTMSETQLAGAEYLSFTATREIIRTLTNLAADGVKYREIRHLLK